MKLEGRVRGACGMSPRVRTASSLRAILGCLFLVLLFPLLIRAQNVINTIGGGGDATGKGNPTAASIGSPRGITEDTAGNIYASGEFGQFVFKVTPLGAMSVLAGTGYSGYGVNGTTAPANTVTLANPAGLGYDSTGNNLFIASPLSQHVFKVNLGTGVLSNVAGTTTAANTLGEGIGSFGGDGGPATQAQLYNPSDVAFFNGNVYIADAGNNRIRVINSGGIITTFAGNGTACSNPTSACGDNGPATQASLNDPTGVAVDTNGNVYIVDTLDNRVREIPFGSANIIAFAGNGNPCVPQFGCGDNGPAVNANLNAPSGASHDTFGNLYIADQNSQEIRAVNVDGTISLVAGTGVYGFVGDPGPASTAEFSNPRGVYADSLGNLLIADQNNNRVREDIDGNISTVIGGGIGGDGGPALQAVFGYPSNLALDTAGDQFITDTSTSSVREISAKTGAISTVAGNGTAGYGSGIGSATTAILNQPSAVAADRTNGNLFIADTFNDIIRTVQAGNISTIAGIPQDPCPSPTNLCGDSGMAAEAQLNQPNGVSLGSGTLAGDIIISDSGDNRIRLVDNAANISTVAGTGKACAPPTAACGDGGPATQAALNFPFGVAVDAAGDIFIADAGDNRIRRVDATTQTITTVAFSGNQSFSGDGGPATLASMNQPLEVALDATGNLFIAGGLDQVVRRVDAATQTISTVAGNAATPLAFGFAGDGGPATVATIGNQGLAVSSTGVLYIADSGNNRIRSVQLSPTAATSPATLDFGNQMIGGASSPMPVTLMNSGGDDLLISSITDANEFSQTNNCPIKPNVLAPGQSCVINVTFTPTGAGTATDTLIITDNAAGSPHNIPLSAMGTAPFQLTTNCTSLTVVPGQTAIYTVSLTPAQGFTKSVSLACSGVPKLANCTVSPSNITLDGATTIQAQVTATTTPATADLEHFPSDHADRNRLAGLIGFAGFAGLAGLVILPGSRRAKQARRLWAVLFCLCMISTMATMSSCGPGLPPDPPGTAAGTYPLTVTATFQSGTGTAFTEKVSFDLVVQ